MLPQILWALVPALTSGTPAAPADIKVDDSGFLVRPITSGPHVGESVVSRRITVDTGRCRFQLTHDIRADESAARGVAPMSPSASLGLVLPWPAGFSNGSFLRLVVRPPGGPSVLGAALPKTDVRQHNGHTVVRMVWSTDHVRAVASFLLQREGDRLWIELDATPKGPRGATWQFVSYPVRFSNKGLRAVTTDKQTATASAHVNVAPGENWAVYYDKRFESDPRLNLSGPGVLVWDRPGNVERVDIAVGTYPVQTTFRFRPGTRGRLRAVLWQYPKTVTGAQAIERVRSEAPVVIRRLRELRF